MALILKFDKKSFQNEKVAKAVQALCELEGEFADNDSIAQLKGHLSSLANTFDDEETAIKKLIAQDEDDVPIATAARKSVKFRNVYHDVPVQAGDCIGCDDEQQRALFHNTVTSGDGAQAMMARKEEGQIAQRRKDLSTLSMVKLKEMSPKDVATYFEDSIERIESFMSAMGIDKGNAKTATGLAKKILKVAESFTPEGEGDDGSKETNDALDYLKTLDEVTLAKLITDNEETEALALDLLKDVDISGWTPEDMAERILMDLKAGDEEE